MNYNVWNKWDKLQTVMLGDCYDPAFFREIKNTKVKSALQRIADQTQEDLEGFHSVLKDFGCTIIRPDVDKNDSILNYTDHDGKLTAIPRSPLQPRDCQLVIGNSLFYTGQDHLGIKQSLDRYDNDFKYIDSPLSEISFANHKGDGAPDWPSYENYIERFCNLFTEMSEKIQFIVITHKKITMEYVEQLIGVTMGEKGVSKLVNVSMKEES